MPRLTRRLPSYRLHKPSGKAVVTLNGRDHYLGNFGSPESRAEYDRVLAEHLAGRRPSQAPSLGDVTGPGDLTINEVLLAFWRHAEKHYRTSSGKQSSELGNFRDTLRPLKKLYGSTIAREFSPLKLKAVRRSMIDSGLCRNTINQRIGRIVHVFKWAVSEELLPASTHQALKTVSGLQKGRTEARESQPVRPVSDALVEAVRPFVARQIWAMVELQRLTGMRPGEVCLMRTCDLETSGPVWTYTPSAHKTEHHDRDRKVYLGPRAQAVLKPWLRIELTAYLFSPTEAMEERRGSQRSRRKTPMTPSQRARKRKAKPRRPPSERYTTRTYAHAVTAGCRRAFPHPTLTERPKVPRKGLTADEREALRQRLALTPVQRAELREWRRRHHWHPNQLRHNAATNLRREFGLDVARVILGHSSTAVTEVYAEVDREKALAVMARVG